MDADFQRPTCKKAKLWVAVAKQLEAVGGYRVSGLDCSEKWRNLQATYKRNKDKKGTSGHQAVSWEYYEFMDDVLGQKASTQPPAIQLFSSLPPSQVTAEAESQSQPCNSIYSKQMVASKKRAPKQEEWMKAYCNQQEKRQKMWEEQKALEEKKIDSINNLTAAINRLAERPEL